MDTEIIQLKNVTKRFKKNLVLDGINLSIPEKQITGIIGASGEGKSTILKLIIGFYKPTKGEVLYLRRNVLKDLKNIRTSFGFATEDGSYYEDLTVRENVFHFGRLYKMKRSELKKRVKEVLHLVELTNAERTRAKNLSVGMKKRLDIACAIVYNPQVLILDEPTADLDPILRDEILNLIKKIKAHGTTVVFTTQLLEEMDKICDKIAILHNKKIVEEGNPNKIKNKYRAGNLNDVFDKIFGRRITKEEKREDKENSGNLDTYSPESPMDISERSNRINRNIHKPETIEKEKDNGVQGQIDRTIIKSKNSTIEDFGSGGTR